MKKKNQPQRLYIHRKYDIPRAGVRFDETAMASLIALVDRAEQRHGAIGWVGWRIRIRLKARSKFRDGTFKKKHISFHFEEQELDRLISEFDAGEEMDGLREQLINARERLKERKRGT